MFNKDAIVQPYKNPKVGKIKRLIEAGKLGRTPYDGLELKDLQEIIAKEAIPHLGQPVKIDFDGIVWTITIDSMKSIAAMVELVRFYEKEIPDADLHPIKDTLVTIMEQCWEKHLIEELEEDGVGE